MRIITWALRLIVFVLLVAFAAKNVEPVTLRFYFDLALQTPLVVALFGFFAVGVLFGILSLLGAVFLHRRELSRLRRGAAPPTEPPPPAIPPVAGL
ncbi:MAG TPA: LapA family protein [Burkholderiales bacterium]|nr:LapA family protein [Burkholderiales bacterium]